MENGIHIFLFFILKMEIYDTNFLRHYPQNHTHDFQELSYYHGHYCANVLLFKKMTNLSHTMLCETFILAVKYNTFTIMLC